MSVFLSWATSVRSQIERARTSCSEDSIRNAHVCIPYVQYTKTPNPKCARAHSVADIESLPDLPGGDGSV